MFDFEHLRSVPNVQERNNMERADGYTFEKFFEDLKNGFQIYYTYMDCRYLIYKLAKNCYKNELIEAPPKCPHQKNAILTLKRVKEIFDFMENMEYRSIDGV